MWCNLLQKYMSKVVVILGFSKKIHCFTKTDSWIVPWRGVQSILGYSQNLCLWHLSLSWSIVKLHRTWVPQKFWKSLLNCVKIGRRSEILYINMIAGIQTSDLLLDGGCYWLFYSSFFQPENKFVLFATTKLLTFKKNIDKELVIMWYLKNLIRHER